MADDHLELNRASWDERVPVHVNSDFSDAKGFLAGTHDPLRPFEIAELGEVEGLDLVHLQCHFGLDTLAWARRGANVTGVDFSVPAIEAARRIAADVALEADFVACDVYDAVGALGHRTFDVVYTGLGALIWLPDVERWAGVVAGLLRPGGVLYLAEFHPIAHVFGDDDRRVERDYFDRGPFRWDEDNTYASTETGFEHAVTIEWQHTLADVLNAVVGAGLVVESFHEHDHTLYPRWPDLVVGEGGRYDLPAGAPRLPLMYSLTARRPT